MHLPKPVVLDQCYIDTLIGLSLQTKRHFLLLDRICVPLGNWKTHFEPAALQHIVSQGFILVSDALLH